MKLKYFIFFLLFSSIIKAQNLNFDLVFSLRTKPLNYVDNILSSKNWVLNKIDKQSDTTTSLVNYRYKYKINMNDFVSSLSYYYRDLKPDENRIFIQLEDINLYNSYLKRIIQLGFRLKETKIEENNIMRIYIKHPNTIEVTSGSYGDFPNKFNLYTFFICNSNDYFENFIFKN